MKATALLTLSNISHRYGERTILSHVDMQIRRGEITTIIGPNGAGKTTLVRILTGLLSPLSGHRHCIGGLRLGYVPQRLQLDPSMPLKVSRFLSLANGDRERRAAALAQLNISHLNNAQVQSLSGGEFQRVMLARAILRRPDILVLDEPAQGVDISGQTELYTLIAQLREKLNCAVVMVSHDLHLVMAQTDSVLCLNQHVCCHGKPESVSRHPEYLKLFGSQAAQAIAVYTHQHDHEHDLHGNIVQAQESGLSELSHHGCHHD